MAECPVCGAEIALDDDTEEGKSLPAMTAGPNSK